MEPRPLPPPPTLTLYRRQGCHLCDDAREALQVVLEERAAGGQANPRVREVDIAGDPELEARHGFRVPVLELGGEELALTVSARAIRGLLERGLQQRIA